MTRALYTPDNPRDPIMDRRVSTLERRSLTRQTNLAADVPEPAAGGAHFATRVVALLDATDAEKFGADYVADGSGDQDVINQACADCDGADLGGDVRISGGNAHLTGDIDTLSERVNVHGAGQHATALVWEGGNGTFTPLVTLRGGVIEDVWIYDQTSDGKYGIQAIGGRVERVKLDTTDDAIYVTADATDIIGVEFGNVAFACVYLDDGSGGDKGTLVANTRFLGLSTTLHGVHGYQGHGLQIVGCHFEVEDGGAITLSYTEDTLIEACRFRVVASSSSDAVLRLNGTRATVLGCDLQLVSGTAPEGVNIGGGAIENVAAYNVFRGFAGGEIVDGGTASVTTPNVII